MKTPLVLRVYVWNKTGFQVIGSGLSDIKKKKNQTQI